MMMKKLFIVCFLLIGLPATPIMDCYMDVKAQTAKKKQPRMGTINRDGAVGAVSKEADKLFTQYANNNDEEGIIQMLLEGLLVYLPKNERVTLVEYGFATLKIRTKKGQILYVAREYITLDDK